jgi:hypothetical protein
MKTKTLFAAMLLCAGCIIPNADPEDCVSKDCVRVTIAGSVNVIDSNDVKTPLPIAEVSVEWMGSSVTAYRIVTEYVDNSSTFSFSTTIDTSLFAQYQLYIAVGAWRPAGVYFDWTKSGWGTVIFDHFDKFALQNLEYTFYYRYHPKAQDTINFNN